MTGPESRITEEQARRLWERAAALQAEADRRREEWVENPRRGAGVPCWSGHPSDDPGE